ncbi:hypothetical protein [Cylindrospermopsis raciborskii]|uniref:hypothetical protein n=1 Tax=Cylindrospermopsis raciborskii TaxID=77022 RepID=UPI0015E8361D|nr:hypothetical protein [Cylindrospermopsis raciborskii]
MAIASTVAANSVFIDEQKDSIKPINANKKLNLYYLIPNWVELKVKITKTCQIVI